MITDFFLTIWLEVSMWVLELFGEYEGLPTSIEDAADGVGSLFSSAGSFFGALDQWFPVSTFLTVAVAAITVEVGIAFVRGVRVLKQLLPFQ